MSFDNFVTDTARSIGFLSRLPVPDRFFHGSDAGMQRAARTFPLAGLIITFPSGILLAVLLGARADPLLSALVALAVMTFTTGALHEDGLADTADGMGGGRNRERILAIMKDSSIGTYGAISLIVSFGLRAAALAAIGRHVSPAVAFAALVAAASFSRGLMVWHWCALPPARENGLAAQAGQPASKERNIALGIGGILAVVACLPGFGAPALLAMPATAWVAVMLFTRRVKARIGGHTGDTIGASQQICECTALCVLALAT